MKNKNENRQELLQRFVSKSHQVLDDIVKLTVQIQAAYPGLYLPLEERSLFVQSNSSSDSKDMKI